MSCEALTNYNFCTIAGKTVFRRDLILDEATQEYEIFIEISGVKFQEQHSVESGHMVRVDATTWGWKERKETLSPGTYDYRIIYKFQDVERTIGKGTITVKKR